jgi:hypothetical protein
MAPRRPTPAQLRGTEPIFILTVTWAGRIFRLAEVPLLLSSDDGTLRYDGGLELLGFTDTLGGEGTIQQGGSASMGATFHRTNIVSEYIKARPLEGASCELSMIFVRSGAPTVSYEQRLIQLSGTVSRPQMGFPGRPAGFAAFTLTARPYDDITPVLSPTAAVTSRTHPAANLTAVDGLAGAAYPLVFGSPGSDTVPGSPAYLVRTTPLDRRILISSGTVEATRVALYDEDGDVYTSAPVSHAIDALGQSYAYVLLTGAPVGFDNAGGKHYCAWTYLGLDRYGILNPFGPGGLSKAGDVVRYLFGRSSLRVDHPAWVAASGVLDRYTLGGYVNDPTVTVWSLVSSRLLPLLPISVRLGPDGLYPVSLLPLGSLANIPQLTIDPSQGLEQASPVQVTRQLSDVVNQLALSYLYNGREDRLSSQIIASTDTGNAARTPFAEAQRSAEIYGVREGATVDAEYISDDAGAEHALRWLLYDRGFLHMAVQIAAAPRWGWLMVGDQVSLTSTDLGLSGRRATVHSKTWDRDGGGWRFELAWSLAPIENNF